MLHLGQRRLRHEEAHAHVARRQQRDDRPAGLHHLAVAEVDLLDGAGRPGASTRAPLEPGLGRVEPRLGRAQRRLRVVERLLRADRALQQLLGALVGLARVDDGRLVLGHGGALQVGIEREQRRAGFDRIALAHGRASPRGPPRRG